MSGIPAGSADLPPDSRATLAAGRLWATRAAPYLAHAVLALRPVVVLDPGPGVDLSAFPVDKTWNIYIDPAVLADAEPADVGFWHLHHVGHLLRRHAQRCPLVETTPPARSGRSRDEQRWNEACDAEVDDDLIPDLLRAGLPTPPRALLPADLNEPPGQLAETYFRRRVQAERRRANAEDRRAEAAERRQADAEDRRADAEDRRAEAAGALPPPAADCGSGVDGRGRNWDIDQPALSDLDCTLLANDTARRIREANRLRGDTPAGWQRWAEESLSPVIDWRRQLARAIRRGLSVVAGRVDYSYHRPSRRAAAVPGVVLPTMRRPVPRVAVVVDTSGSVSGTMLGQVLAEVGALLRRVGSSGNRDAVRLISCDAQAFQAQRVLDVRDVKLLGGGGTDMGAGLIAAAELRPPPDVVVVLTDGHTPWPAEAPGNFSVVVALLDSSGSSPEWAARVVVDTNVEELFR